jgi:hypothetical protein
MRTVVALVTAALVMPAAAHAQGGMRTITAAERASISRSLANNMRDPDSARFRFTQVARSGPEGIICGMVNGKNGFGGHTGFQPFIAMLARQRSGNLVGVFVSVGSPNAVEGQVAISMCRDNGLEPVMAK